MPWEFIRSFTYSVEYIREVTAYIRIVAETIKKLKYTQRQNHPFTQDLIQVLHKPICIDL